MGFQTILIAFVADLFAANRKMLEEIRFLQRESMIGKCKPDHVSDAIQRADIENID